MFMNNFSPLSDASHHLGLETIEKIDAIWIHRFIRFIVKGVNKLMAYLNDPRNFLNQEGSVNFLQQVKAYSSVQLLFADVYGLSYSTFPHNRISYSMSALDKLAQLRNELGGVEESMQKFASFSQKERLCELITDAAGAMGYPEIAESLKKVVHKVYRDIHEQIARQCNSIKLDEREILDRIWLQRNIRHGAFLRKEGFEKLFLTADGTIASTFGTLPYLLAIGLVCDPKGFLGFDPKVSEA